MDEENYCIRCEEQIIVRKSFLDSFLPDNSPKPRRFKNGWMCGNCYKKKIRG